jgi:hypothetical protein
MPSFDQRAVKVKSLSSSAPFIAWSQPLKIDIISRYSGCDILTIPLDMAASSPTPVRIVDQMINSKSK